ncbi:unnamed protein product [Durusdinium trenchii]|uniref:Uncharacterized protein n=1 Tax=Durusdinium trenchii TaxID=1381693 RepID=A0ABP0NKP4_9DINO
MDPLSALKNEKKNENAKAEGLRAGLSLGTPHSTAEDAVTASLAPPTPAAVVVATPLSAAAPLPPGTPTAQAVPLPGYAKLAAIASRLEAVASRLEVIALGLAAIASRLEAMALRLEVIALRLEAIASRLEAIALRVGGHRS